MTKPKRSLAERIADADARCSTYLANANEAEERGDRETAEKLYAKSGFWRDRYNRLKGDA